MSEAMKSNIFNSLQPLHYYAHIKQEARLNKAESYLGMWDCICMRGSSANHTPPLAARKMIILRAHFWRPFFVSAEDCTHLTLQPLKRFMAEIESHSNSLLEVV